MVVRLYVLFDQISCFISDRFLSVTLSLVNPLIIYLTKNSPPTNITLSRDASASKKRIFSVTGFFDPFSNDLCNVNGQQAPGVCAAFRLNRIRGQKFERNFQSLIMTFEPRRLCNVIGQRATYPGVRSYMNT